jgi:isopropylmalate/homocitrate/citramalate synthase
VPQEIDVLVSEVGPRDGLQSIKRTMPTEAKLHWIEALAASGRSKWDLLCPRVCCRKWLIAPRL